MSSPSMTILPRSGFISPMTCLSVTLLPTPEPPTMTSASPRSTSMDMSSSTFRPPSVLSTCCSEIIGVSVAMSEQQLRQEEIGQKNNQRRAHHRRGRGAADAFRAAACVVAAHATGERQDQAEECRLDQAAPDVIHVQKLKGVLLIDDRIRAHHFHTDEVAAADAEGVAEDCEEREHHRAGDHARDEEILHGIGGQRLECIE